MTVINQNKEVVLGGI